MSKGTTQTAAQKQAAAKKRREAAAAKKARAEQAAREEQITRLEQQFESVTHELSGKVLQVQNQMHIIRDLNQQPPMDVPQDIGQVSLDAEILWRTELAESGLREINKLRSAYMTIRETLSNLRTQ